MAEIVNVNDLIIKDVISFNTYGVNVVTNVLNGTLLGIVDGSDLRNPAAAAASHAAIYPSLPVIDGVTIPNDFTKYNYLYIKLVDGTKIEVGEPWINNISLTRLSRKTCTVVIPDFDPTVDLHRLVSLLLQNGFINSRIISIT